MKTPVKNSMFSAAVLFAFAASAASITGISANQRWPWNSLVDVDFTISDSSASMAYRIELSAVYNGGANKVYANTYLTEPIVEGDGPKRVTWDLGADCPGLKIDDFTITVTATPMVGNDIPVYMVIDLSAGPSAVKYPVRYTTKVPDLADDKCRTTELWMRRIRTGTAFHMGGDDDPNKTALTPAKEMRLTKDFYMAIFETTQQQWAQVMDAWPSFYSNKTYRAMRPVESITRAAIRGSTSYYPWPNGNSNNEAGVVGKNTFAGLIRARTGLTKFDLPTEAQWVYAALGGAASGKYGLYPAVGTVSDSLVVKIARCNRNGGGNTEDGEVGISEVDGEKTGTMTVGHYRPNAYGLYDMLGNVSEMVLDRYTENWPDDFDEINDVLDYKGSATGGNLIQKGMMHTTGPYYIGIQARIRRENNTDVFSQHGARFCVTLD